MEFVLFSWSLGDPVPSVCSRSGRRRTETTQINRASSLLPASHHSNPGPVIYTSTLQKKTHDKYSLHKHVSARSGASRSEEKMKRGPCIGDRMKCGTFKGEQCKVIQQMCVRCFISLDSLGDAPLIYHRGPSDSQTLVLEKQGAQI